MKLFKFLRKAEKEIPRNLEKKNIIRKKNVGAVFIQQLIDGEMFGFGEPWQLTSDSLSAVVPILRKFDRDRNYLVLQEIPKAKVNVADSGRINRLSFELKGVKRPVFVRAGTIFKGHGTQSRTSSIGVVLAPKKLNLVEVFCVHASHGISPRSGLSTMIDVVPRKVENVLTSPFKSQMMIWRAAAVRGFRARVTVCPGCGSSKLLQTYEAEIVCMQCGYVISPTLRNDPGNEVVPRIRVGDATNRVRQRTRRDDLITNLDEMRKFNQEVEKMLSKIPADLNSQIGIVIIDSRGVLGLEIFDHPDSWRAFSRSIVHNYADILAKERAGDRLFELKTDKVSDAIRRFLEKAQKLSETSTFKNKISETWMFSGELAGEYTTMGSDVIHLTLKRKATKYA